MVQQARQLIDLYLDEQHMMQLATSVNGRPWCCSLYYVHDSERNLYWASFPERRHSQEIEQNPNVAIAIPVQHAKGEKVIGIQIEGSAKKLTPDEKNRPVVELYAKKFGRSQTWVNNFVAGRTRHQLYQFTPKSFVLFDDLHFPDNPRVTL